MSEANIDFWRKNVDGKVDEVQRLCAALCTTEVPPGTDAHEFRSQQRDRVKSAIDALSQMFAVQQIPVQISSLRSACDSFLSNRDNPQQFRQFYNSFEQLRGITSGLNRLVSFHDVFEAYKGDQELTELVDRLVATLEQVLNEGDEHLNRRVTRELERILEQLRARSSYSLYELATWVEIAGRFAAEVVGQKYNVPGLSLLVDAVKLAQSAGRRIVSIHQLASADTVRLIEVETISSIPLGSIPVTEEEIARLEAAIKPLRLED